MTYQSALEHVRSVKEKLGGTWDAIRPEDAARMIVQNRLKQVLTLLNTLLPSCVKTWQSTMLTTANTLNHQAAGTVSSLSKK